jgi:hypothetical protein
MQAIRKDDEVFVMDANGSRARVWISNMTVRVFGQGAKSLKVRVGLYARLYS